MMCGFVANLHSIGCKILFVIPLTSVLGFELWKIKTDQRTSNGFLKTKETLKHGYNVLPASKLWLGDISKTVNSKKKKCQRDKNTHCLK